VGAIRNAYKILVEMREDYRTLRTRDVDGKIVL
jgi:hypothetical protein